MWLSLDQYVEKWRRSRTKSTSWLGPAGKRWENRLVCYVAKGLIYSQLLREKKKKICKLKEFWDLVSHWQEKVIVFSASLNSPPIKRDCWYSMPVPGWRKHTKPKLKFVLFSVYVARSSPFVAMTLKKGLSIYLTEPVDEYIQALQMSRKRFQGMLPEGVKFDERWESKESREAVEKKFLRPLC